MGLIFGVGLGIWNVRQKKKAKAEAIAKAAEEKGETEQLAADDTLVGEALPRVDQQTQPNPPTTPWSHFKFRFLSIFRRSKLEKSVEPSNQV